MGTDLLYSAGTKLVGGARHLTLRTVNVEIALWMAAGSVPASVLGVFALNRLAASEGAAIQSDMKVVIGVALMLVAITVAVRTFVTIRGLWDASTPPADADIGRKHRYLALVIGARLRLRLRADVGRRGRVLRHGARHALPALGPAGRRHRPVPRRARHRAPRPPASFFLLPSMRFSSIGFLMIGSIPGILIGSQLTVALPERALRGSLASVLALSSLKMLGAF